MPHSPAHRRPSHSCPQARPLQPSHSGPQARPLCPAGAAGAGHLRRCIAAPRLRLPHRTPPATPPHPLTVTTADRTVTAFLTWRRTTTAPPTADTAVPCPHCTVTAIATPHHRLLGTGTQCRTLPVWGRRLLKPGARCLLPLPIWGRRLLTPGARCLLRTRLSRCRSRG